MQKLLFKSSWLFLLIPIGMIYFVFVPQIQKQYERYNNNQINLQNDIRTLDSLKYAKKLNRKGTHLLKKLEITVPVHQKVYGKQKFLYYKTGGMLLVLVFMGIGMLVTIYFSNRKKTSSKNKQIDFIFDDFTTDKVGRTISWNSLENLSSNFASETFKKTAQGYKITGSSFTKVFAWSFFLIGLIYLIVSFYEFYQTSDIPLTFMKGGKLFFISGGPFLIVGIVLLFMFSPKVYIYTRKRKIIVGGEVLTFQQIYALQILEKFTSGNSSSGSYFSYELNLITKNGERYNLLNHGDKTYILSDMIKISKLLKLPVWNNGVV
ncbi:hypothetical protein [Tenacibaculum dicentrarchi]|uniref:hypothetical protein n=1 Tax=Tenacibaculum dicentrarchi TaxID=669041 RepID=UPI000CAB57D0|nr:conserved membrane hypothetical protein [Tenacibaculum dicentrarchi]